MKYLGLILAFMITLPTPSQAQDFKKGIEAYKAGDYAAAIMEWGPLAISGESGAQFLLGATYDYGHGVIQDYKEAIKWYQLAAIQGHSSAQYFLGLKYERGHGVPSDNTIAYMWFSVAVSNLSKPGKENRDRIANKMKQPEINIAQIMANECTKSNYKNCGY